MDNFSPGCAPSPSGAFHFANEESNELLFCKRHLFAATSRRVDVCMSARRNILFADLLYLDLLYLWT